MKLLGRQAGIFFTRYVTDIKKEVFRKSIHICTAFIPFLLHYFYLPTLSLLICAGILYTVAELCRLNGKKIPFVSTITEAAARKRDENRFVLGPLTLVIGICCSAVLWNETCATVGIFALAFGDGLASLAGKLFGMIRIPGTSGKTVAGSLTCFVAIFCSTFLYTHHTYIALLIACVGMAIEVLPLKDFDNILIPIALGGVTSLLLP